MLFLPRGYLSPISCDRDCRRLVLAYHAIFCIALGTASNPLLKDDRCWKDRFEDQCIGCTLTLEYAACFTHSTPLSVLPRAQRG